MDIQEQRLAILKNQYGFRPNLILDIGAHTGEWARMAKSVFAESKILMFEANEEHKQTLVSTGFEFEICLLGNENKENVEYFATKQGYNTGNSIFLENTHHYSGDKFETRNLSMFTIDHILQKRNEQLPHMIKLDVQGAEKMILEGCRNSLGSCEIILLETQLLEYNKNAPMMFDIMKFMDEIGYQLFDIVGLHYLPNQKYLFQTDLVFAKKTSFIIPSKLSYLF